MIWQNMTSDMHTFKKATGVVIEYIFNNHSDCGNWCQAKKALEEKKPYNHLEGWLLSEKPIEAGIYRDLLLITEKYGSEYYLAQSQHKVDTQTNKIQNQSQARLTSKSKVFHESQSFNYSDTICIGVHK